MDTTTKRKIFFVDSVRDPFDKALLGGQKVTIELAETLRSWGYEAYVVSKLGRLQSFRYRNKLKDTIYLNKHEYKKIVDVQNDIVVLPGRYAESMGEYPGDNKVLFSQGAYITLSSLSLDLQSSNVWRDPSLKSIFCVSEGNAELFRQLEPDCPIHVIPNKIDLVTKINLTRKQILLYPDLSRKDKNPYDTTAILQILLSRLENSDLHIDLKELAGLPFSHVQNLLAESSLLVFPSIHEGLPLLPLEAMAAGTIVLGYNRRPLSDILHPSCLFEIGELSKIAETAYAIIKNPDKWTEIRSWQFKKLEEYSAENHLKMLKKAWTDLESRLDTKL